MSHPARPLRPSRKAARFEESVIREMTRVARAAGAINLAQGFPDFPAPEGIKRAAIEAIQADVNQYAVTWGSPRLRAAIARFLSRRRGFEVDAETQITVVCGATEGMIAAMMGVLDPGDEVLIPEPFYENYGPDGVLSGAVPIYVPLNPEDRLDLAALRRALTPRTRAVVLNTPHNPTGRVFDRDEISALCAFIREHDLLLFTDEIYEEILYTGPHHSPWLEPGMADRTLLISGASKTFAVTGWRVGWVVTPAALTSGVRKVHDFLTVGAPAPLQEAVATALGWEDSYYQQMRAEYRARRDCLVADLQAAGFACEVPEGAYYLMTDCSGLMAPGESDTEFALRLVREAGIATVPGSSFYAGSGPGDQRLRFCYAKKLATLQEAGQRLRRWSCSV